MYLQSWFISDLQALPPFECIPSLYWRLVARYVLCCAQEGLSCNSTLFQGHSIIASDIQVCGGSSLGYSQEKGHIARRRLSAYYAAYKECQGRVDASTSNPDLPCPASS